MAYTTTPHQIDLYHYIRRNRSMALFGLLMALAVVSAGAEACPPAYCFTAPDGARAAVGRVLAAAGARTCDAWVGRWTYWRASIYDPPAAEFVVSAFCRALAEDEANNALPASQRTVRPRAVGDTAAACVAELAPHRHAMGWSLDGTDNRGSNATRSPAIASARADAFSSDWRSCLRVYTRAADREPRANRLLRP